MISDDWLATLSRICAYRPVDLEPLLAATAEAGMGSGDAISIRDLGEAPRLPSSRLWPKKNGAVSCIGIRVLGEIANPAQAAYRLAAAALERGIVPIILATHPNSGLERFGFRVELLAGHTADELRASEAELMRFWDISVVINSSDIAGLL